MLVFHIVFLLTLFRLLILIPNGEEYKRIERIAVYLLRVCMLGGSNMASISNATLRGVEQQKGTVGLL